MQDISYMAEAVQFPIHVKKELLFLSTMIWNCVHAITSMVKKGAIISYESTCKKKQTY